VHAGGDLAKVKALLRSLRRKINPRYAWLSDSARRGIATVLDVGGEPRDSMLAATFLPNCRFTALNIVQSGPMAPGAEFIRCDLDRDRLAAVAGRRFDYVISSHTLEHLRDGIGLIKDLAELVADGGRLYLEWPSPRSRHFPLRGVGLHFEDDPTHVATIALEDAVRRVQASGLTILAAGPRRNRLRALLAPILFLRTALRFRRLVLYDFWDWTGYADMICAVRPGDRRADPP